MAVGVGGGSAGGGAGGSVVGVNRRWTRAESLSPRPQLARATGPEALP